MHSPVEIDKVDRKSRNTNNQARIVLWRLHRGEKLILGENVELQIGASALSEGAYPCRKLLGADRVVQQKVHDADARKLLISHRPERITNFEGIFRLAEGACGNALREVVGASSAVGRGANSVEECFSL